MNGSIALRGNMDSVFAVARNLSSLDELEDAVELLRSGVRQMQSAGDSMALTALIAACAPIVADAQRIAEARMVTGQALMSYAGEVSMLQEQVRRLQMQRAELEESQRFAAAGLAEVDEEDVLGMSFRWRAQIEAVETDLAHVERMLATCDEERRYVDVRCANAINEQTVVLNELGIPVGSFSGAIGHYQWIVKAVMIPDDGDIYDSFREASDLSYDKLIEWTTSEESKRLHSLARWNPGLFNSMLEQGYAYKIEGNFWSGIGLALNLLGENGWIALIEALTMLKKFDTGGEWDMKIYLAEAYDREENAKKSYYFRDELGRAVRADMFGNVNYAVMMAHWGVNLEMALKGANMEYVDDLGIDAGVTDPLDDRAVRFGYDLYKRYPNGLSQEQYFEEIANAKLIH